MDAAAIESAAKWRGKPGAFVEALLAVPSGETAGFLELLDSGVYRLRNWRSKQPWARAYADAQSLRKTLSEAGRRGGHRSVEVRRAAGWLSNGRGRGPDGRFRPEASPEASPEAHPEASPRVTSCETSAAPKPTDAFRVPVSGEEKNKRGSPEASGSPPSLRSPASDPITDSWSKARAELASAGASKDAIADAYAVLDRSQGPWVWKRAATAYLGLANGSPKREPGGPVAPDERGRIQADEASHLSRSLATIYDAIEAGTPITERDADFAAYAERTIQRLLAYLRDTYPDRLASPHPPRSRPTKPAIVVPNARRTILHRPEDPDATPSAHSDTVDASAQP